MSSEYQELLEKLLNSDTTDVIPQSRSEYIMLTAINSLGIETLPKPGSRMEAYLMALITKMGEGGSGGDAPYIGDNGNWYVGQTDTGVAATGPQGIQGETGPTGAAGYTPVRGTDYWTAEDKQAIVYQVLAALPDGDEVGY